jgi:septal ring factor EnvC (AmiA/AmiB activator)
MWPKVLAQLIELLPHVSRLVPMADKFLNSKAAAERANEAAFAAVAEGVRGDLGQVTKAHAGLYRQLQDQSAQIAGVGDEVKQTRAALEQQERKIESLERRLASVILWIKLGISLLVVLSVIALVLLVQMHNR